MQDKTPSSGELNAESSEEMLHKGPFVPANVSVDELFRMDERRVRSGTLPL
jgi:hypothetical protein